MKTTHRWIKVRAVFGKIGGERHREEERERQGRKKKEEGRRKKEEGRRNKRFTVTLDEEMEKKM